ncbi:MAG: hypothetical protein FWF23_01975 [Alphaproteobacteria bacterium]|nr:hypothetical protein [Alphaproteobacteria bacterium]MCL2505121.1 hypothetical protein [Alphaproteobacteria bacterium]
MQEKIAEAKKAGKPVLVIVGEDHTIPVSANLEICIAKIAKDSGFKSAAIELNKEQLKIAEEQPASRRVEVGAHYTIPVLKGIGIKCTPMDSSLNRDTANRENHMSNVISNINEDAICITGMLHVPYLAEKLKEKFTVVSVLLPSPKLEMNMSGEDTERKNWLLDKRNDLLRFSPAPPPLNIPKYGAIAQAIFDEQSLSKIAEALNFEEHIRNLPDRAKLDKLDKHIQESYFKIIQSVVGGTAPDTQEPTRMVSPLTGFRSAGRNLVSINLDKPKHPDESKKLDKEMYEQMLKLCDTLKK